MNNNTQQLRVAFAGGGTGGHVFPLVAVARALKHYAVSCAFVGPEEFPLDALREEGVAIHPIVQAGKIRRYLSIQNVVSAVMLPIAFLQSILFLRSYKPHVLLGKGGYGSVAPVLAARALRIPIILHESDVVPGLATRTLARFANIVALSFAEARGHFPHVATTVVGNPVRHKYADMSTREARSILGLSTRKRVIFITGGSQGARFLNTLVRDTLGKLAKHYGVIISTGADNDINVEGAHTYKHILVRPFLNEKELAAAYTLADVVISRAGAGSIFEIAAYGTPSIIIPLSTSAGNHQLKNARAYEKSGACVVLEEDAVDRRMLLLTIETIMKQKESAHFMSEKAQSFARPDAADALAERIVTTAQNHQWGAVTTT